MAGLSTGHNWVEGSRGGSKGDPHVVVFEDPDFARSPAERLILRGDYTCDTLLSSMPQRA